VTDEPRNDEVTDGVEEIVEEPAAETPPAPDHSYQPHAAHIDN
jgi:hypothetical protein